MKFRLWTPSNNTHTLGLYDNIKKVLKRNTGLSVELLDSVKKKLQRNKQYYRSLTRDERSYIHLCIRCKPKFKSPTVINVIMKILKKVSDIMNFTERVMQAGRPIAERLAMSVHSWGNSIALKWKEDPDFIFYWGLHSQEWR